MDNEKELDATESPLPQIQEGVMMFNFSNAIQQLIEGKKIRRMEWEDKEEYGLLKDSWLTIHHQGKFSQWMVNEGDLLAEDWIVLPEGN